MDAAYDDQVYVDDRTIDSHIKRLRKKFKAVDDDFEMIDDALWCRLSLQGIARGSPARRGGRSGEPRHPSDRRFRFRPPFSSAWAAHRPGHNAPEPTPGAGHDGAVRLVADAPHRLSQSGRAGRSGRRLPLRQPVPRRADRRPRAESANSGRDHRCGDLGLG